MANKRMFSKQITNSDAFMDMPVSSQLLYFHLNMEADDDGFVANPKRVMRMLNVGDDDMKILLAKRFLLSFESGVVVIKHWLLHNAVRRDMYQETQYLEEKKQLQIKDNKVYTEICNESVTVPLHRLDKIRLDKDRIEENIELPIWLNKKAWEAWIQYKKERKQKMTPSIIKFQLNVLEKNQQDHTQIIKNSITNGWTGLFELKGENKKQTPPRYIEPSLSKEDNDRRNFLNKQSAGLANKFKV